MDGITDRSIVQCFIHFITFSRLNGNRPTVLPWFGEARTVYDEVIESGKQWLLTLWSFTAFCRTDIVPAVWSHLLFLN